MFTLSVCARSLFTLSAFVLTVGAPGAATDQPALSDVGVADQERPVVALLDRTQEAQRRRTPPGVPGRAQPGTRASDEARPSGPPPVVRFEAAVYRLAVSGENAIRIDAVSLSQAGSLVEFDEALRAFGEIQVLYRVDQTVDLQQRGRIRVSADQPYVSGSSTAKDGRAMRSIAREGVGVDFDFSGESVPGSGSKLVRLSLEVELSALEQSAVQTGADVTAPLFRKVEQRYCGAVELGRPIVLLNLDGACTDSAGRAVAFVTRIVLGSATP
jgi:hypothetical protein